MSSDGSPQRDAQKPSAFLSDAERASNSVRFYDFDRYRIDTKRHLLMRDGEPIAIKPKALDMLLLLVRHRGRLLGKEELMNRLWPDTAVEEANLTQNVFVVRKALGEAPGEQRFIATVARQGYRFVGNVREVTEEEPSSPDDAIRRIARAESPRVAPRRWSLFYAGSAGLLSLAAGILAFNWALNGSLAPKSESLSGRRLVRLTSTSGLNTDPALSPDGSLLAYASDRAGTSGFDIWVQAVAGGDPIRVTDQAGDEVEPSFSADGTRIVYSRPETDGIYAVGAFGGEARLIAKADGAHNPRYSPDGRWIAYWAGSPAVFGAFPGGWIFVMPSDGGPSRALHRDFVAARHPIWSPNGKSILFLGKREAGQSSLDWYVTPVNGAEAIKTGAFQVLRDANIDGLARAGGWSARGDAVIFATNEPGATNIWSLGVSPSAGHARGAPQRLTFGTAIEQDPAVAATGRIAFTSAVENVDVWRVPLDAKTGVAVGALERITDNAALDELTNVSDDGRIVTFISSRTKHDEAWVKDLKTGQERQLTYGGVAEAARISHDGLRVAISSGARKRAEIVPSIGGPPSPLCSDCTPWDWMPDLSGSLIARGRPSSLLVYDFASKRETTLAAHPKWSLLQGRVSPDGRWVAFHTTNAPTVRQIYVVPVTDKPIRPNDWIPVVTDFGVQPSWSPDGSGIYHVSIRDGAYCVWLQPLDPVTKRPAGAPQPVQHFHQPRLRAARGAAASNDVRAGYLYVTLTETTGNVWLLEQNQP